MRKSPIRHRVRSYTKKDGTAVSKHLKGSGMRKNERVLRPKKLNLAQVGKRAKTKRVYRFDLSDIVAGTVVFTSEGDDISDASNKLAEELDEDVSDILITLETSYIWNPIAKEWVPNKPWWEEEKELYEWEKMSTKREAEEHIKRIMNAQKEVNFENLTYSKIPPIIYEGREKWILFGFGPSRSYAERIARERKTPGASWLDAAKDTQVKKIKDGYVVYEHW